MLEVRHQPDLQARARRTLDVATPDLPPTTSSVLGGRIVRRFLVAVGVISLVAACGGSRSSSTSIRAACIAGNGYGGLGGRADAFDANNNDSPGPSGPTPGTAWYEVTHTEQSCVTAFMVRDTERPELGTRQLLFMVSHPYLPKDAKQVAKSASCMVWKSLALQHATGLLYAKATAVAQAGIVPGSAQLVATSDASC